jgi:hypothetical protein
MKMYRISWFILEDLEQSLVKLGGNNRAEITMHHNHTKDINPISLEPSLTHLDQENHKP